MKKLLCVLFALAAVLACVAGTTVSAEKAEPDVDPESPLYKKMALFVGDSICEAIYEQRDANYSYRFGWGGRILYNNEMRGVNLGKSGASVSDCRGANTIMTQLVNSKNAGKQYDMMVYPDQNHSMRPSATVLVPKPNTFIEADRDLMPTEGFGINGQANYSISTVYNKQA